VVGFSIRSNVLWQLRILWGCCDHGEYWVVFPGLLLLVRFNTQRVLDQPHLPIEGVRCWSSGLGCGYRTNTDMLHEQWQCSVQPWHICILVNKSFGICWPALLRVIWQRFLLHDRAKHPWSKQKECNHVVIQDMARGSIFSLSLELLSLLQDHGWVRFVSVSVVWAWTMQSVPHDQKPCRRISYISSVFMWHNMGKSRVCCDGKSWGHLLCSLGHAAGWYRLHSHNTFHVSRVFWCHIVYGGHRGSPGLRVWSHLWWKGGEEPRFCLLTS
jgi:hypothetical protein